MSSMDGMNFSKDLSGLTLQYAASDGSAPVNTSTASAVASASEVTPIEAAVAASAVSNSTSPDLSTLTSSATNAVNAGSWSGVSLAALGDLGSSLVTAERLIATLPAYLGSGVDLSA